ncbi:tyrosine-type recombinase/integrase [Nafulsella turpanensis]|uniref:tyrosine-type recombinase/integrase n=1 Tax=Nafulsella turpanensis TaxID=1265690 RepID=UPI000366DDAE|nr:tyrosine-type recombinase/integrase [Nafulsella turpanensis]
MLVLHHGSANMIDTYLRYLTFEKRYSAHTLTSYQNDLEQFQAFLQEQYQQNELSRAEFTHIRAWIVSLVDEKLQARSINRKIASLRSFYKFLLKRELIQQDPCLRIKALKTPKALPHFVQEKELSQLLDQFPFTNDFSGSRDKLVLELLYATGIRLAELIGLREESVDMKAGTIRVLGKRNKERVIPVSLAMKAVMEQYLAQKNSLFGKEANPRLILTDKGEQAYPMFVYRLVKKYLGTFTSSDKQSPHVLRHTFATHLLDKGADLNAVKDLLGHTSLAATQVYTHNSLEKLRKVFEQAHPKA